MSKVDQDWWRGAVIYQIYPRSYQDSTGDGTGDIAGIVKRLPYIASLGADAIWVSPFFKSPMKDFGYDVSDYCDIDPMFGSLADFDALIATAHELNLKVMIDLVLSHTSDQHPWFVESRQNRTNDKADWYVWSDPKPDGTPPNNWLSIFGGSAWQWDARREQYFLHNFLTSQPDLNFHNPDVQQALLDVARFWLERDVDGFRLDTINFYVHDQQLRDNPALPPEQRNSTIAPSVNPYNHQDHQYDKNQPENLDFLRRLRGVMNEFPAIAAVGEVGDAQYGMEIMGQYTAGDDLMHMCYAFDFLSAEAPSAARYADVLNRFSSTAPDGWACWAFSNHDVVRHMTRLDLTTDSYKALLLMMLGLPGSVCLYQGEELGLPEADVAFEDLQDPYGIEFWPEFKGRDGCRTPMVWSSNDQNGGFSGAKPWLPVSEAHTALAANLQADDPDSMLEFYKAALKQRKALPALAKGSASDVHVDGDVLWVERFLDGQKVLVMVNLSASAASVDVGAGSWTDVFTQQSINGTTQLAPWQAVWATA